MQIYVDADACPVKEIIIEEAADFGLKVDLVSSISHFSLRELPVHVKEVYVDSGAEAADYKIMQLIHAGDLLVTQDYGLASLALSKGAVVLHHQGYRYTPENIGRLLEQRYFNALARKSGKRTKGPRPLKEEDREQFRSLLYQTLEQLTRSSQSEQNKNNEL